MDRQRTPNSMCENRTLTRDQGCTSKRWRDKSGSPVASQALDRACLSPCRAVGSRAAPWNKINDFNEISGTVLNLSPPGGHQ